MVAIFVLLTIMLFITIEAVRSYRRVPAAFPAPLPAAVPARGSWQVSLPAGLFLHPGHTWAEISNSGLVRVGLDDLVSRALGHPDRVELRLTGERVVQGEAIVTVECNGREISLPAPVSGTIERINETVMADPSALAAAPYGGGWLYEVKPSKLGSEISSLAVAEVAYVWLRQQFQEFGEWLAGLGGARAGLAMQDGGEPAPGALAHVDAEAFEQFSQHFIHGVQITRAGQQAIEARPAWAAAVPTVGQ